MKKKDEEDHVYRVLDARGDLWEHLKFAYDALKSAQAAHRRLKNGNAFDVEYEGDSEFGDYLEGTLRLLVVTRALMPTDGSTGAVDPKFSETVRALMAEGRRIR